MVAGDVDEWDVHGVRERVGGAACQLALTEFAGAHAERQSPDRVERWLVEDAGAGHSAEEIAIPFQLRVRQLGQWRVGRWLFTLRRGVVKSPEVV